MRNLLRQLQASFISPLAGPIIGKIVYNQICTGGEPNSILITASLAEGMDYSKYAGILVCTPICLTNPTYKLPPAAGIISPNHSLDDGDIVSIRPCGTINVLYRRKSLHNDLFITQRCNSRCLMCSQPPIENDDPYLLSESIKVIKLADKSTPVLGITGGEPTLLEAELLKLIELSTQHLPNTQLHLLTNGRLLQNESFAKKLAAVCRANLSVAFPLYSDIDSEHDYIIQTRGGFAQTVRGIHNLARYKIPIEIRVVIHKLNYQRLPQLAEFIYRNLTFVNHVALMALEPIGFAADNIELLWIDPFDYRAQLGLATRFLADRGINVSIYNHQLCIIPEELRSYSCKSISDWKVEFLECCKECSSMSNCGGFFKSALPKHHSTHIGPI